MGFRNRINYSILYKMVQYRSAHEMSEVDLVGAKVIKLTLKTPRNSASENVICLSSLLNIQTFQT